MELSSWFPVYKFHVYLQLDKYIRICIYIYMPMFVFPFFWIIPILFRGASGLREAEYVTRPIVRLGTPSTPRTV